ncbi:hypothetical protein [Cyanobium sp. Morenito 9A2]|uniref:hypothetical protein n=1 Tax=Cyanobium sp. Morenito 9A2 TaxID=2823718 RepID=UPI0020CBADD2|nr:hypothetical protein [Cyanobium sp. Morenito 9A2]MCP9849455.1 hypothetical protein [Cyanobium sp. Morenito 9A2]
MALSTAPSVARPDASAAFLPSGTPITQAHGAAFTSHRDRFVPHCSWRFWYLHHSKKVWFRVDEPAAEKLLPVFTYEGRPILHRSEGEAASRGHHRYRGLAPVLWGDWPGWGWGHGPAGTRLFLEVWTRWSWLHPEACGRPERFGVDFFVHGHGTPGSR